MDGMVRAGWYPDPYARHELRFHDGVRWTPYCADGGQHRLDEAMLAAADLPAPAAPAPGDRREEPGGAATSAEPTGPTGLTEPAASAEVPESGTPGRVGPLSTDLLSVDLLVVGREPDGSPSVLDADGLPLARVSGSGRLLVAPTLRNALGGNRGGRRDVVDVRGGVVLSVAAGRPSAKQGAADVHDRYGVVVGRLVEQRGSSPTRLGVEVDERFAGYVRGPLEDLVVEDIVGRVVLSTQSAAEGRRHLVDDALDGALRIVAVAAALCADSLLDR